MSTVVTVRYTTRAASADENASLIADVFAELAASRPEGLHYVALRLEDGVSFVHTAVVDGEVNPLASLPAFARFQAGIAERCTVPPAPSGATVVGSYGLGLD